MSTDTKASAGAMRAAQLIIPLDVWTEGAVGHSQAGWKIWQERSLAKIAEIVDRETHVAELVEALEVLLEVIGFEDGEIQRRLNNAWPHNGEHYQPLTFAESALRRFKEGL